MKNEYFQAVGKRKTSVARAFLKSGAGAIVVNDKSYEIYFPRQTLQMIIRQPLEASETLGKVDVMLTVKGGGSSSQAGAVRHAIARALLGYNAELRPVLKVKGLLTRDDRKVERKKYGKHKARRSTQFSKR